ncbi:hypothetical protein [Kiloniella sp.]|uniref:hypothetical protein n=1 Tax=Kiloniella sp. TaxID=1938587 RepID=UPI003A8D6747
MSSAAESAAGAEILKLLMQGYSSSSGVHTETILGAAAALAGESALLAAEDDIPDKGWVMSEKAAQLIYDAPTSSDKTIWTLIRIVLHNQKVEANLPDPADVAKRVAAAVGGSPFPPLSISQEHYPHEWSPNACPNYRLQINDIAERHGLDRTGKAMAMGFVIGFLLAKSKEALDTEVAATLVLEVMIGVSHMIPLTKPV